jgi:exosortase/archaeosortase family protein
MNDRNARREAIAARKGRGPSQSWFSGKRPILRFVLVFALLTAAFNILYYTKLARSDIFRSYLNANALVAAAVLRGLGTEASASDGVLSGGSFVMKIAVGCDALQPIALFCFAVLASPLPLRFKLPGLLAGTVALLALNIVRIATLFWTGIHAPRVFEILHVDIWQTIFIIAALMLWVLWALWAMKRQIPKVHAAS